MKIFSHLYLLPRNIGIAILKTYRRFISPLYGDVCRYYPTCSHYALIAVQNHGLLKGAFLGLKRLVKCHPWAPGGVDDVPESKQKNFVITEAEYTKPKPG